MLDSPGRVEHSQILKWGIRLSITAILLILLGRLFQLQVLNYGSYAALADSNRLREITIPAPRGLIFDRNGTLLARNRPSYQLAIVPSELTDDDVDTEIDEEFEAIVEILAAMKIESDRDATVRIQTAFFQQFGYSDYLKALQRVNAPVSFLQVPSANLSLEQAADDIIQIPDFEQPSSIEGVASLIQTRVQLQQQGNASQPIPILNYEDRDEVFAVAEQSYRLPGMLVLETSEREYVYGEMVSHILGFMGPIPVELSDEYLAAGYQTLEEEVGLSGIEASYQSDLRGRPGLQTIEVDIFGQARRVFGESREPIPGQDVLLTLNMNLQQVMFNALLDMMALKNAPSAVSIAMDPRNGQILGMVSLPSFDNNIFSGSLREGYARIAQDERRPLINYAIGGLYPPGSTFKIVTALAGLEENVISPRTVIVDSGPIYLPNRFAPDDPELAQEFVSWNHAEGFNHGSLVLRRAIAVSNDIFFYQVGGGYPGSFLGLEQSSLVKWAQELGYGEQSGIDLPGEVRFDVPDDQWKRRNWFSNWVTGDSYNMAIGQGYMLATPLQVLQSVTPVANGGTLYQPQLALRIVDPDSGGIIKEFTPEVVRTVEASMASFEEIRRGMQDAVHANFGTATGGRVSGVTVAGKTGTAEYCEYDPELLDCIRDEEGNLPTHASYLAFAPVREPEIAVMVFIFGGGEGSDAAVPVATEILNAYFRLKERTLLPT